MKHLSERIRRGTMVICPICRERVVLDKEEGKNVSGRCKLCQYIVMVEKD